MKLISNLLNTSLSAHIVLVAARRTADADRPNDFVAGFNRHTSLKSNDVLQIRQCRCGGLFDALSEQDGRNSEHSCRIGFALARLDSMWAGPVVAHNDLGPARPIHDGRGHAVSIFPALFYCRHCNIVSEGQRNLFFVQYLRCGRTACCNGKAH